MSNLFAEVRKKLTSGAEFGQVLDFIYDSLSLILPFDRLGIALLEKDKRLVSAKWTRSSAPAQYLKPGYAAPLAGSSLENILATKTPRILADLEAYLAENPHSDSTRMILKDGIRSSLTCPLIANGDPVGFVFFSSRKSDRYTAAHIESFQKIADELSLLVEFARLNSFFKEHNSDKQNLRSILHDLKTPLSIIQGLLEILATEPLDGSQEETRSLYAIMLKNSGFMFNLLEQLSAFEQAGNQSALKLTSINLREFCGEIEGNSKVLTTKKNIGFTFTVTEPVNETFTADRMKVRQVLENLISNAVKFSWPGSSIEARAFGQPGKICFTVQDHGQGVPENEMGNLFKEFGKTSIRPTAGESSSGLGLAIARRIVESHHGEISAQSLVNKGSLFSFWLPA